MEDVVAPFDSPIERLAIRNVAADQLDALVPQRVAAGAVEPRQRRGTVPAAERPDPVPTQDKGLDQPRADKARGAGDQDG
jgi:selenophosphate synthase